jgi:hypothetical protein
VAEVEAAATSAAVEVVVLVTRTAATAEAAAAAVRHMLNLARRTQNIGRIGRTLRVTGSSFLAGE